ncbi:hypothetical protein J2X06_003080 [Lysobacter niastensis]|uniref:Tetratricopeptide repeat protein n=1 Tax=Lysobacter niastensis TaxID=380629 RepID=A0ABU1WE77_9GAMM|nr:hypothetical protein [Lysobacter niastensis]MDR7135862.1 hypothetical protein [Lysobacter niastensis]
MFGSTASGTAVHLLRLAIAIALAAAFAIAALELAQVDGPLGPPRGPDRIVEAIPADADAAADLKAAAAAVLADRPVDGRGFRLLAQRAELEGQGERARELYRIAVERAPRDRLARAKLLDDALVAENYDLAGEHVDALLRVMPTLGAPLLATLVQSLPAPALQAVLAPRLASDPPWRAALATALRQDDVDPATAEALLAALAERLPPTDAEAQARIELLVKLGRADLARGLWRERLAPANRARDGIVFDGGFEGAWLDPGTSGPFGWQLAPQPGVAMGVDGSDPAEGVQSLVAEFSGRVVAFAGPAQALVLEPGRYRLSSAFDDRTGSARAFFWRLSCADGWATLVELNAGAGDSGWQRVQAEFEVGEQCPLQWLQLRHAGRSSAERQLRGRLQVDAVAVTPLVAPPASTVAVGQAAKSSR